MSDYLEGEIIKHIFRTGSFTKPTVLAIALCSAAPTDASTGATITELANANGYSRQSLNPLDANWTAPGAGGLTDNASLITFGPATGSDWAQATHIAICDSATWGAGNMLLYGTLAVAKTVQVGDRLEFAIGAIDVTFA